MSELDDSLTEIALGAAHVGAQQPDHGLYVKFKVESVPDEAETRAQGRACFKQVDFIEIQVPGDRNSLIERPVRLGFAPNDDNQKFAREYELFKQNRSQAIVGTPLTEWPPLNKSQVQELAYFNVTTLEQLAGLSDTIAQKFMGANQLRELAKRFLQQAKDGAPLLQMQAELAQRDSEIASLREQVNAMVDELGRMRTGQPSVVQPVAPVQPVASVQPVAAVQELPEQPPVPDVSPAEAVAQLEEAEIVEDTKSRRPIAT